MDAISRKSIRNFTEFELICFDDFANSDHSAFRTLVSRAIMYSSRCSGKGHTRVLPAMVKEKNKRFQGIIPNPNYYKP